MTYWASWWADWCERTAELPFQAWVTGSRERMDDDEEWSYCARIEANSEEAVEDLVEQHFPDCEFRFCQERPDDWYPPRDRFPPRLGVG
jgi:hypothetical protein